MAGEFNVAMRTPAPGLRLRAGFVSKLPDNPVARIILNRRAPQASMSQILLMEKFDGVRRSGRVGLNLRKSAPAFRPSATL